MLLMRRRWINDRKARGARVVFYRSRRPARKAPPGFMNGPKKRPATAGEGCRSGKTIGLGGSPYALPSGPAARSTAAGADLRYFTISRAPQRANALVV